MHPGMDYGLMLALFEYSVLPSNFVFFSCRPTISSPRILGPHILPYPKPHVGICKFSGTGYMYVVAPGGGGGEWGTPDFK